MKMGFFNSLKNMASGVGKAAAREVSANYGGNKDFLEAIAAAAALVAYADGELEAEERAKVVEAIGNNATLGKIYDRGTISQVVEQMLGRAKDTSGRIALGRELDDIKSKPNAKAMAIDVLAIAYDVAMADGEMEEPEKKMLDRIAARMGVSLSELDMI